ncbi:hypothetical protein [Mangrovicoccus ximenensis]|uniref:hypothetical protein n=1 Tax=Mangrovicoccus ximenensis TaxID=1911570 RepID=UPI000D35E38B
MALGRGHVARQSQHPPPFAAMRPALPLVAQVVLVFLHVRHGHHREFQQGQARPEKRHAGEQEGVAVARMGARGHRFGHVPAFRAHHLAAAALRAQVGRIEPDPCPLDHPAWRWRRWRAAFRAPEATTAS